MVKNLQYDYDTLREQYEDGDITSYEFIVGQSDSLAEEYYQFCVDEGLIYCTDFSALAFMDYREALFEESLSY